MKPALAMDHAKVRAAARNPAESAAIFNRLDKLGILRFDPSFVGKPGIFAEDTASLELREAADGKFACDAQPELVTVANGAIPSWLSNFFDPTAFEILTSPLNAVKIMGGETQYGSWTTDTATFVTIEYNGVTSSYGDYNTNGMNSVNLNFPQRQSYHFQTFTQWGEKQLAKAALARVDLASEINKASMKTIAQFFNLAYFKGISGIQNYGLLNDPGLAASIISAVSWNATATTAEQVFEQVRRLYVQIQYQSGGTIDQNAPVVLATSPTISMAFTKTNQYGVNVYDLLKKNFPNIRFETDVYYGFQTGGELVQMIVESVNGQKTATPAFTEKMRAHAVVTGNSSWSQKKSAGTFGTVIKNYTAIASMTGA
jgi:hypothetical protein